MGVWISVLSGGEDFINDDGFAFGHRFLLRVSVFVKLSFVEGFFCGGFDDGEVFAVNGGVSAEGEATAVGAFEFGKEARVFFFEAVENLGVDDDDEVAELSLAALDDGVEGALDFDAHGHGGFDAGASLAIRAGF